MRISNRRTAALVGAWLLLATTAYSGARADILDAIPADAIGFAVIHNFADASQSIDEVARLVKAPAPNLLNLAKVRTGVATGFDEHGDFALVITRFDATPKVVAIVPVADLAALLAALHASDPGAGIVEGKLADESMLVAHKGNYVLLASPTDRDALAQVLSATKTLAGDASLTAWLPTNHASLVITSEGVKLLVPKLRAVIVAMQATMGQIGPQGKTAADVFQFYVDVLTAAESEVSQFALALRIDAAQTIDVVKQVQFTPGGAWAASAATVGPTTESVLAHLPAEPFVAAVGGVLPQRAIERLMGVSIKMMKSAPGFNFSDEQAEKYGKLASQSMRGVQSMRMFLGIAEPQKGLYGNTTMIINVDDSARYLRDYEASLAAMGELAKETGSPAIPAATVRHVPLSEGGALEVTMDMSKMTAMSTSGGPDIQKMMKLFMGSGDSVKAYLAPADDHAVVMAYTSIERLQKAIDFYRSKAPGLIDDARVAKVAAALPAGSQAVAYVSLNGISQLVNQVTAQTAPAGPAPTMPQFSESPPIGVAVKVSPTGFEGHLVITAETLKSIGDAVAKARSAPR